MVCATLLARATGIAGEFVTGSVGGRFAKTTVKFVVNHFTDHSLALPKALVYANERSWQALGIFLAGDGILDFALVSGDVRGVREQVRAFLKDAALDFRITSDDFRKRCQAE